MKYFDKINSPTELKSLNEDELKIYSEEIREKIIETVNIRGGHLASNLGVVELSVALHYVFDCPEDKIIWDVGHQCYAHKIITGRKDGFEKLRTNGGISGFPSPKESKFDAFLAGHSSTSLSAALGFALARDRLSQTHNIVAVIGDGALTGGMAYEALNEIGETQTKMIIVLNDNKMSISENVGAMSKYLNRLRLSGRYRELKRNVKRAVSALPFIGDGLVGAIDKSKDKIKGLFIPNKIFESLGIKYVGPFDGHDISDLIEVFESAKKCDKPILIHVCTEKGRGDTVAENNPSKFHGIGSIADSDKNEYSFSAEIGKFFCNIAESEKKLAVITAAMRDGTGLKEFSLKYPEYFYDVGIAEQHAVTMAAGMAMAGLKPYFAVYSTFLQRGFDQILHDVCLQSLPVRFLIDRAGAVGADGKTHQGIYDLSYLSMMPGMTVCTPKDVPELTKILQWSLHFDAPLAIRYPKSCLKIYNTDNEIHLGKWEKLVTAASNVYIIAAGNRMIDVAVSIENVNVYNALFIKPLDEEVLKSLNCKGNLIITLEDNVASGGFGEAVRNFYGETPDAIIVTLSHPDKINDNRNIESTLEMSGLNRENILRIIKKYT